jgi:hypothetical protein
VTSTSPSEEPWETQRPRDRDYDYVLDRIAVLSDFASRSCREPSCGTRDEDGNVVSCSSKHCGEKRMEVHHRRELQVMRDIRALIEWLERSELQKAVAEDKKNMGKRR